MKVKLCKLCYERPAEVPDRNTYHGKFVKEVCKECHSNRLRGDFINVIKNHYKRMHNDLEIFKEGLKEDGH